MLGRGGWQNFLVGAVSRMHGSGYRGLGAALLVRGGQNTADEYLLVTGFAIRVQPIQTTTMQTSNIYRSVACKVACLVVVAAICSLLLRLRINYAADPGGR